MCLSKLKFFLTLLVVLLISCGPKQPELISVKGFQNLLTNYNKSSIDEYLLKEGYTFLEITEEPNDGFYNPKAVRLNYSHKSNGISLQVSYLNFDPIEVKIKTSDANVYLRFKAEAREAQFKERDTQEYDIVSEMSYSTDDKDQWLKFLQANDNGNSIYVVEFKSIKITNEAVRKFRANLPADLDSISPMPANSGPTIPVETLLPDQPKKPISDPIKPQNEFKTFSIEHTDLFPEENRKSHDYQGYSDRITGTIEYADFHNGILEVNGDDGQLYALRLLPDNLNTSLKSDVRYFMRAGNKITCIATLAGARELIIVSATFTSDK